MVVGLMSAGLCGEGMPIMKGMPFEDPLLCLWRDGESGCAVLEPLEPARGRRRVNGAGIAELDSEVLGLDRSLFDRPRIRVVDGSEGLRSNNGLGSAGNLSGEFRIASAITSIRGGVRTPLACSCAVGDSYNPYRGRGGRSGVDLSWVASGTEAER